MKFQYPSLSRKSKTRLDSLFLTPPLAISRLPTFPTRTFRTWIMPLTRVAIDKASALVEALSYIQRFHNKVVVVKVGGSIMDDEIRPAPICSPTSSS